MTVYDCRNDLNGELTKIDKKTLNIVIFVTGYDDSCILAHRENY